jgi:putative transposase
VHLIRNTFRLTSRRDWDAVKRDVKPIYTAVNAEAARAALDELAGKWGSCYGAVIRLWEIKCLYLVTRSLDPTGTGKTRWTMRTKPALNAFAITFVDRFPSAETY